MLPHSGGGWGFLCFAVKAKHFAELYTGMITNRFSPIVKYSERTCCGMSSHVSAPNFGLHSHHHCFLFDVAVRAKLFLAKKNISQLHQPHVCRVSQPLQVVWSTLVAKCGYWKSGCERLLLLLRSICCMREEPSSTWILCLSRQTADLIYVRLWCCGVFWLSQSVHGAHDSVCM